MDESADFIEGLERQDLAALRRCPKADLHNHSVLGGSRAFLRERTGRDIAPVDRPLRSMAEMHEWVDANVVPLLAGRAGRLLSYEATIVQARDDGVTRLEIGDDVWLITQDCGSTHDIFADRAELHRSLAPGMEWIPQLGISRHRSIAASERDLRLFLELGVFRTLDLSGDEFAQPTESFVPLYRLAKEHGLRLKAHVGEWGTADDVWRAVEMLELDEVQHGIAAADSPRVMRMLADHRIRLNICPTSNLMLGRVSRLEDHPIRKLHDAGVRVTVNTDDVLVFGSSVSDEFLALYRAGVFTATELDRIRRNALTDA